MKFAITYVKIRQNKNTTTGNVVIALLKFCWNTQNSKWKWKSSKFFCFIHQKFGKRNTKKNKNNETIWKHMNTKFDWMSSALAAQMYAAQLSSQQQQNMYVIIIKFKKKEKKNKQNQVTNIWNFIRKKMVHFLLQQQS